MRNKYVKGVLAILVTVLLGALGSGLWEGVLKSAFVSGRDLILNLVSFGMQSVKQATYAQIAQGLHEHASMDNLSLTVVGLIGFMFYLLLILFGRIAALKEKQANLHKRLKLAVAKQAKKETRAPDEEQKEESLDNIRKAIDDLPLKGLRRMAYAASFVALLFASAVFADLTRFKYVNSAITHFQQAYTISLPYIDESQRTQILSSFAQIKGKQDYVSLMKQVEAVGRDNGQSVPGFDAW